MDIDDRAKDNDMDMDIDDDDNESVLTFWTNTPACSIFGDTGTSDFMSGNWHQCLWGDCKEGKGSMKDLSEHVSEQHIRRGRHAQLTCMWNNCGKPNNVRAHIISHMNVHVPAPVWKCVECGDLFSTWHRRRTHMIRQHYDAWATRYGDCPDCGHVYLSISDTTSHLCGEDAGNTSRNVPRKPAVRKLAPISEEQELEVGRSSVGMPKLRPYLPFAQKLRVAPPKHDLWKCITTRSANGQLQDEWLPFQVSGDGIFGDLFAEADDSSD